MQADPTSSARSQLPLTLPASHFTASTSICSCAYYPLLHVAISTTTHPACASSGPSTLPLPSRARSNARSPRTSPSNISLWPRPINSKSTHLGPMDSRRSVLQICGAGLWACRQFRPRYVYVVWLDPLLLSPCAGTRTV